MNHRHYRLLCPIARSLDRIGDRWTLLVLRDLHAGPARFSDLQAALPGLAPNLLTTRLRQLEQDDLVCRREIEFNVSVYELTPSGAQTGDLLYELAAFGSQFPPAKKGTFFFFWTILALKQIVIRDGRTRFPLRRSGLADRRSRSRPDPYRQPFDFKDKTSEKRRMSPFLACVARIYTDLAVLDASDGGFRLAEMVGEKRISVGARGNPRPYRDR